VGIARFLKVTHTCLLAGSFPGTNAILKLKGVVGFAENRYQQ